MKKNSARGKAGSGMLLFIYMILIYNFKISKKMQIFLSWYSTALLLYIQENKKTRRKTACKAVLL